MVDADGFVACSFVSKQLDDHKNVAACTQYHEQRQHKDHARAQRDACRAASGGDWDEEEFYLVYEDAAPFLPARCEFSFFPPCAGVLRIVP